MKLLSTKESRNSTANSSDCIDEQLMYFSDPAFRLLTANRRLIAKSIVRIVLFPCLTPNAILAPTFG